MATANNNKPIIPATESLIHPDCGTTATIRPITNIIDLENRDKDKISLNGSKGFLFDIIVVRLDIPNKSINDTSKLLVDSNFCGKDITITSSRINVLDFKAEPIFEFTANLLSLKDDLTNNPLRLKVIDEVSVLGYGCFKWPEEFLSGLVESAGEMMHSFETELKECDGTKTGTIQAIIRLQPKCEEYKEDDSPDGKCRNANKEIDTNDILFVVGEDKKHCCCSEVGIIPASDSDHELQPKCLDLSNFRAINSQNVNNIDILSSLDPACQKLKTVTNHYQELIDAVMNKSKDNLCVEKCHKEKEIFYTLPPDNCLDINVHPSSSDYRMPLKFPFEAKNPVQIAYRDNPPDLVETEPISLRCCPLCKENMTFLPKLTACPNCCYKPVPCFEEKLYNDEQNADQILQEFQDKLHTNDNPNSNTILPEQYKCHCSCKYGSNKPCAHCRIRKLCEPIFHSSVPIIKTQDKCEQKSSDVHCASSSDNRPFLSKIFSELKDLYDIEEPKKKIFQPDEHCERKLNKEPTKKKESCVKSEIKVENQKDIKSEETAKRLKCKKHRSRRVKPATELAVKSRLYDYQLLRQTYSTHIGHKTCINGFAGRKNVPPNMGWLWNVNNCGKWKPGYIRKPIKELMKYFLKDFPADTLLVSQYSYRKKSRNINDAHLVTLAQTPTLHIHKQNGEYIVTMRPLKPIDMLKDAADPYENMKPIQFRIVKNPRMEAIRDLKKCLKEMGFKKCTCHRPIIFCYCRSFIDKKKLEYACNRECSKRNLETCCDTLVLSDTSDSEAEFDFGVTPPVGVVKPERLRKVNVVNVGTQYDELDWNTEPLFPQRPNKYMQMYQCAIGERKEKSAATGDKGGVSAGVKAVNGPLRNGTCAMGSGGSSYGKGVGAGGKGVAVNKSTTKAKGMAEGVFDGKTLAGGGGAGKVSSRSDSSKGFKGNVAGAGVVGGAGGGGGGDGLLVGKVAVKGGSLPNSRKYGGRVDPDNKDILKQKVDMLKYTMKLNKKISKMSPAEIAAKRKEKMNLLKGANPPLLCMVDRRGKPIDPCAPFAPCPPYDNNRNC